MPSVASSSALGLECQAEWCRLLLSGEKIEETRTYTLPEEFRGRRIWLLASSGGPGAPSLGDTVQDGSTAASIVGWVAFSAVQHYTDKQTWAAARTRHLVPDEGAYSWSEGGSIFGWVVSGRGTLAAPLPMVAASRIKRSLYQLQATDDQLSAAAEAAATEH